jgi:hypothetical protein
VFSGDIIVEDTPETDAFADIHSLEQWLLAKAELAG